MSENRRHRTDVIGSLLRPSYLLKARQAYQAGRLTPAQFKRVEDRAVDQAIALQEGCGLDVITDGEMRRLWFTGTLTEAVEGLELVESHRQTTWHGTGDDVAYLESPVAITGKLRQTKSLTTEEFAYTRARATRTVKVTLPSPMMLLEFWSPKHSTGAYTDIWEAFADATDILCHEARVLADLGCEYIQLDAPEVVITVDKDQADFYASQGAPQDRMLSEGMEMLNTIAATPGVKFALHMCRGNWNGMYMSEGGYESISREVFARGTNFDVFCLEYDDYRSGSFKPLGDVPEDKKVVLGLVCTKRPEVEPEDGLIARIEEASRYFPKDQLAISTQCGFAPVSDDKPITEEIMERKLTTIANVGERVWG